MSDAEIKSITPGRDKAAEGSTDSIIAGA